MRRHHVIVFGLLLTTALPVVAATAPSAPSSPSPSDQATNTATSLTLTWQGGDSRNAGSVVYYDVYFGTDNPPASIRSGCSGITTKSCSVSSLAGSTTYYWRVKAVDDVRGETTTGSVWRFTTGTPNTPPTAATNPSPGSGSSGHPTSIELGWVNNGDPDDATVYTRVYLDTSSTPTTERCARTQSMSQCTVSGLSTSTTYRWFVRTDDNRGGTRDSAIWSFTTQRANTEPSQPSSPSPGSGSTGHRSSLTLGWSGGTDSEGDAVTFTVRMAPQGTARSPVSGCSNLSTKRCDLSGLSASTTYEWQVEARDSLGASSYSSVWNFRTNIPPNAPNLPTPAHGSEQSTQSVTLSWSGGDADSGQTVTYSVRFDAGTNPTTEMCSGTSTSCTVNGLSWNTQYSWKVTSSDSIATTNGPVWSFQIGARPNQAPPGPTPSSPADGATNVARSPTLSWSSVTDPDGDAVTYVVTGDQGAETHEVCRVTTTSCTWNNLGRGETYSWQVRAEDGYFGVGWGPVWDFTTLANRAPVASFTSSVNGLTVTVDGRGSSDADGDSITSYAWQWGDGTTSTGATPSHTYTCDRSSLIRLTVSDAYGATGDTTRTVEVADPRDADADGLSQCREVQQGTRYSDPNRDKDSDGDMLDDHVESVWWPQRAGTFCHPTGSPCMPLRPTLPDVLLEIDWFPAHRVDPNAVVEVQNRFIGSARSVDIQLIADYGAYGGGTSLSGPDIRSYREFQAMRETDMASARRPYFYYHVIACDEATETLWEQLNPYDSLGQGDSPGWFSMAYDCAPGGVTRTQRLAQVLNHELGHNLLGGYNEARSDPSCAYRVDVHNPALAHFRGGDGGEDCSASRAGADVWYHSPDNGDLMHGQFQEYDHFKAATWNALKLDFGFRSGRSSPMCTGPLGLALCTPTPHVDRGVPGPPSLGSAASPLLIALAIVALVPMILRRR